MAVYLGYESAQALLEPLLLSLVELWRKENLPLVDFPSTVIGCDSPAQFFQ